MSAPKTKNKPTVDDLMLADVMTAHAKTVKEFSDFKDVTHVKMEASRDETKILFRQIIALQDELAKTTAKFFELKYSTK